MNSLTIKLSQLISELEDDKRVNVGEEISKLKEISETVLNNAEDDVEKSLDIFLNYALEGIIKEYNIETADLLLPKYSSILVSKLNEMLSLSEIEKSQDDVSHNNSEYSTTTPA